MLFDVANALWAETDAKAELWERARIGTPPEVRPYFFKTLI